MFSYTIQQHLFTIESEICLLLSSATSIFLSLSLRKESTPTPVMLVNSLYTLGHVNIRSGYTYQGFGYHVNFTPTFTIDMHIFRKGRMLRSPHFKIYYLKSLRDLWSLGYLFGTKRDRVAMLKQAREPFLLGKHYQYTFGCEDLRVQV